jgi:citrate lyase subunit beta/citryl-CoA lyase
MARTRRSVLVSPGDRPEILRKAPDTGADVVVFDLEDAVVPARKDEARGAVNDVLRAIESDSDADDPEVLVRVTPEEWDEDLDRVLAGEARPDGVMLPKADSPGAVEALADFLDGESGRTPIVALIESARGVLNAAAIADVPATDALCFGAEDLAADVGAERTLEGTEVLYAREKVVLAAVSAGVDAIDTVFTAIGEPDRLREETAFARGLGYDGKMAIHPDQVPVINDAFTPEAERVEWAERVLDAREAADAESRGVFRVDGEMIDAPLIAQAERIVALASAVDVDREEGSRRSQDR